MPDLESCDPEAIVDVELTAECTRPRPGTRLTTKPPHCPGWSSASYLFVWPRGDTLVLRGASLSDNASYYPGFPIKIVGPQQWRNRPMLFLGPDRSSWWRVVVEHFLAEVGAPGRRWSSGVLHADGNRFTWLDDSDAPLVPLGHFWREACRSMNVRSASGSTSVEMVLDSLVPSTPTADEVLHLVRRCTARVAGRSVRMGVGGREVTVASDWRQYLSDGAVVGAYRRGVVGDYHFEVAAVASPGDGSRAVEVLEQGAPKGTWPGLLRLWELSRRAEVRVVVHSEERPGDRESGVTEALRRALATI